MSDEKDAILSTHLKDFMEYTKIDYSHIDGMKQMFSLPIFSPCDVKFIINEVTSVFKSENMLMEINSPMVVVGDIHGHIFDLFRIIQTVGGPSETKFLFLGDIVDRGEFSIETCIFIYLMKAVYPKNVFMIRGNHEFSSMCRSFGFANEINRLYNDESIFEEFMKSFSFMPIAARIDHKYICLHGGIGPNVFSLLQMQSIERPLTDFTEAIPNSILWSDPAPSSIGFEQSTRGCGFLFGEDALYSFLTQTESKCLIRGHECVMDGVEFLFNESLITVFSASNYCGSSNNKSGILQINGNALNPIRFEPLHYINRSSVYFQSPLSKSDSSNIVFKDHKPPLLKKTITQSTSTFLTKHKSLQRSSFGRFSMIALHNVLK